MKKLHAILVVMALSIIMVFAMAGNAFASPSVSPKMTNFTSNSITVKWEQPNFDGYANAVVNSITIYDSSNQVIATPSLDATSYTFKNLSKGVAEQIKVVYNYDWGTYSTYNNDVIGYCYVNTTPITLSKSNIAISYFGDDYVKFKTSMPSKVSGVQYKLYNVKTGKCVGTKSTSYGYTDAFDISLNKAYKYKARVYYTNTTNNKTYYGAWSPYRYFDNLSCKYYTSSSYNGCKIKLKGVSKVSKYKIYVSTTSFSDGHTGKLVKTVSPKVGKSTKYTINKRTKSSKMKNHKTYYVKVVPVIKTSSGSTTSDIYGTFSFYNYH